MRYAAKIMLAWMPVFLLAFAITLTGEPQGDKNELNDGVSLGTVPPFEYETTIPGYYLASGRGMALDPQGNAYVICRTIGDYQQNNILILKVDASGDVVWENYIDRYDHDYATGIVYNGNGQVYVTGWTDSDDFPVTSDAMDDSLTGFRDAFLMKLSTDDGSIEYSTLFGGDYTDEARAITLNDAGEIYITGYTGSTDFPTVNAYQNSPSAPLYVYNDVFITKFNAAGDSMLYSTYFGGYKDDVAVDIALDADENIIFAGETKADDFPLANEIFASPNELFVSKLSADGSALMFSTYLGGEGGEQLGGMALDANGDVYLGGSTKSVDFPTTAGSYQPNFVGDINGCSIPFGGTFNCDDVFAAKLSTEGAGLMYSTFLGGNTTEQCRDIQIDNQGNAYLVGYTYSSDYPLSGTDTTGGIFLSQLNPDGSLLNYSLIKFSGSSNAGHGLAVDDAGDVYFSGSINVPAEVYVARLNSDDDANHSPIVPMAPLGAEIGDPNTEHDYATMTVDPESDPVYYMFDWGDASEKSWIGPYVSGDTVQATHSWTAGQYDIKVKARDENGMESAWSDLVTVEINDYICGDVDDSGSLNVSDAVNLVSYVFENGIVLANLAAGDVNCDGNINVSDAVVIVNFIFNNGNAPCDSDGDGNSDC